MVADELTRALIEETTLEDISESYRPVVDIIGIEKFIELSEYAKGDGGKGYTPLLTDADKKACCDGS